MSCNWHPSAGNRIGVPCPHCGHIDIVHTGETTCPVCDLRAAVEAVTLALRLLDGEEPS